MRKAITKENLPITRLRNSGIWTEAKEFILLNVSAGINKLYFKIFKFFFIKAFWHVTARYEAV
jgi:hypothetical protein